MNQAKVQSVVRPRRTKNLAKWMTNTQFGVIHTSLDFGIPIAVESETIKNF